MPRTAQELLVLATQFEKIAVDIPQPEGFEDDFSKWLKMQEKGPVTVREMPAIKLLEPKSDAIVVDDQESFMKWLEESYGYDHKQYAKLDEGAKQHLHEMYKHEKDDNDAKLGVSGHPFDVEKEDADKEKAKSKCGACDGEGYKDGKFCHKCEGSGHQHKSAAEILILVAKKQEKKKLDPKAKVRNRGTVCVPASSAKDKKDHFPINDEGQARNALARVHQYSSAPSWYKGSLKGLQDLVSRKVHSKYPSIGKSDKKKKSSLEVSDTLLTKYANHPFPPELEYYTLDEVAETLPVSKETYRALWALMPSDKDNPPYEGETPPEPDHSSRTARSLKKFWHKLSPQQQQEIISAKAEDEAEMEKYRTPKVVEKNPPIDDGSGVLR